MNTEQIVATLNERHTQIMAGLNGQKSQLEGYNARLTEIEQVVARGGALRGGGTPQSLGELILASEQFSRFKENPRGVVSIKIEQSLTSLTDAAGGAAAPPDRKTDIIELARRQLRIRNLLAPGKTTSNLVQYPRQITRTNDAAVVSETAAKPYSDATFELIEAPVRTIAHLMKASRQIMDDAPALQSFIDTEMRYGVADREEQELLLGDGSGVHLHGIVSQAPAWTRQLGAIQAENEFDNILDAMAQVQSAYFIPDGVVLNSLDWAKMMALKDSQDRYLGGGPFGGTVNLAWQVPVVPTPVMPAGHFMVGAFRIAAQIFDRMQTEVLLSTENADDFEKNLITVRAENRLAMVVKRPTAMVYGAFDVNT